MTSKLDSDRRHSSDLSPLRCASTRRQMWARPAGRHAVGDSAMPLAFRCLLKYRRASRISTHRGSRSVGRCRQSGREELARTRDFSLSPGPTYQDDNVRDKRGTTSATAPAWGVLRKRWGGCGLRGDLRHRQLRGGSRPTWLGRSLPFFGRFRNLRRPVPSWTSSAKSYHCCLASRAAISS